MITKFSILVKLKIKRVIEKLIERANSWEEFSQQIKEEFLLQDSWKIMQEIF
jgi:hypothetical protein